MTRLENGIERKKIGYLSVWEDVAVLQGELKIEQRADKRKCYDCGMADQE